MSNGNVAANPDEKQLAFRKANYRQFTDLLETNKGELGKVLAKHLTLDRMVRLSASAVSRNFRLMECTPHSLLSCLIEASRLGLEPTGAIGGAHLVPFKNNKTGRYEAQLITDYRGLISLAIRSREVKNILPYAIHQNDYFEMKDAGVFVHRARILEKDANGKLAAVNRGDVVAVYAEAVLKDGSKMRLEPMTNADIEKYRAKSRAKGDGPWVTDWIAMAKKTAIRRLCNYLPLSTEFREVVAREDEVEYGSEGQGDFIDTTAVPMTEETVVPEAKTTQNDKLKNLMKGGDNAPAKKPGEKQQITDEINAIRADIRELTNDGSYGQVAPSDAVTIEMLRKMLEEDKVALEQAKRVNEEPSEQDLPSG